MQPKFTPGPWLVMPEECDKPYIRVRGTVLGGRYKVANVLTPVYEGVHSREAEEARANARLIAAAPELLQLVIDLSNWLEDIPINYLKHHNHAFKLLDDAKEGIAKATGEQS